MKKVVTACPFTVVKHVHDDCRMFFNCHNKGRIGELFGVPSPLRPGAKGRVGVSLKSQALGNLKRAPRIAFGGNRAVRPQRRGTSEFTSP